MTVTLPDTREPATWPLPAPGRGTRRSRLQPGLVVIAVVLGVLAALPFVLNAIDAAVHHRVFSGAVGIYPWDDLQYLAFIRGGHSGVIRNLYGLVGNPVYVDPVWSTSGILQGLTGISLAALMAAWTVIAAVVLYAGAYRLVVRHIPSTQPGGRTAALALCLFGGVTPTLLLLARGRLQMLGAPAGDLVPALSLWGYAPIALAIGLMPLALLGFEQILDGAATPRGAALITVLAVLIGWLHPWQSVTLLFVLVGLVVWRISDQRGRSSHPRLSRSGWAQTGLVAAGLAAGPAYYAALSRFDASWSAFSHADANRGLALQLPFAEWGLLPLLLVALVGVEVARRDRTARGLMLWPLAVCAFLLLHPQDVYHTLDGVSLPLGVLTVRAWPHRRALSFRRLLAGGLMASSVLVAGVIGVQMLALMRSPGLTRYTELRSSDVRAVDIAAAEDGSRPIMTTQELGTAVPMLSGAATFVGNLFWTPDYASRTLTATALFDGELAPRTVRGLMHSTGTLAVVEPCGSTARLAVTLLPIGFSERTVGCARVYTRRAGL